MTDRAPAMHWPLLLGIFAILGIGVSSLHLVRLVVDLPGWAAGLLLGSSAFLVLAWKRHLDRRDGMTTDA